MDKLFACVKKTAPLLCIYAFLTLGFAQNATPGKVCIVANSDVKGSCELAEEYAAARKIPQGNIIRLPMGRHALVKRGFYNEKIALPILGKLVESGFVKAMKKSGEAKSAADYVCLESDVDFLVLCKGVPHGIESSDPQVSQRRGGKVSPKSDAAAVDSELAMLLQGEYPLPGQRGNPLYNNPSCGAYKPLMILRTARLDGPSFEAAADIFKRAIAAEEYGFMGRVYIDKANKPSGDAWLDSCAQTAKKLGFDTDVNESASVMGYFERRDGLCAYFGWYIARPKEYFADNSLRFNNGAVGFHIYSYSALNISSPSEWAPALVSRGMSATAGNVFEPFLGTTHRPDIFFRELAGGRNAGEAAFASLPSLSWQAIFIGDPLYKPFGKSLDEQIAQIDSGNFTPEHAYAAMRKANLIESGTGAQAALDYALKYADKFPSLSFSYKLALLHAKVGNVKAGLERVLPFFDGRDLTFAEKTLAMDIAKNFLYPNGAYRECAAFGKRLFDERQSDREFLESALPFFAEAARKAGMEEYADMFLNKHQSILSEKAKEAKARADKGR